MRAIQVRNDLDSPFLLPKSERKMKMFYEIKNVSNSVKDVDEKTRRVKNVISEMGNLDLDHEVMDPNAYNKTISERGPKAANLIWHLTDHNASLKSAIGKFTDVYKDGNQLVTITDIPNTSWGNDVLEFYMKGHINQHSVGFRTIKDEPVNAGKADEYRLLKEVLLYEGSAVLWGANPNTPNLTAGKSFTKEEAAIEYKTLTEEMDMLLKSMRNGTFTDATFELIDARIGQTRQKLDNIFGLLTAQPSPDTVKTTEPDPTTQPEARKSRDFSTLNLSQLIN